MKQSKIKLLSYQDVLNKIEGQENHLLLGNGFNRGLGINTSYESIFQKMIGSRNSVYQYAIDLVEKCNYDLELFVSELEEDIGNDNIFLKKYINNKVKMDFMQATHEIVKAEIKNVYANHNKGVYILLKQFSNYFTLNYDSFLYLLLLNYKPPEKDDERAIAMQPTLKFIKEDLNIQNNDMYDEIRQIRNGLLTILPDENVNPTNTPIDKVTKTIFVALINQYSKSNLRSWSSKDINRVVDFILDEEKKNPVLEKVDDGAQFNLFNDKNEFVFNIESESQNLFFLHGAFQIYKDGKKIIKITQESDKALYDKLENILNNEKQDIVCVFQSDNKLDAIQKNEYLLKCYNKLASLLGNIVIIGCSLSENDNHIIEKINSSKIDTIFISTLKKNKKKYYGLVKEMFPSKEVFLFDADTISYKLTES